MASLEELRDGLHVSVSQIKCYLRCPRQYEFRYVLGVEPEFLPAALVLGSAVHEGLGAYYRSVMETGDSPEFDTSLAAFHATMHSFRNHRLPIQDTGVDLEAQGTGLLKVFYEKVYRDPSVVVGVEVPFAVDIHDPLTGEVLEERLVGAFDLVVEENGRKVIGEHKTASKRWSDAEVKYDLQLSAYWLVADKLGMGDVGLRLQQLTKTKEPKMVVVDAERSARDVDDFLGTVVGVLRAVDVGSFYPMRTCKCAGCPFQRSCSTGRVKDR